MLPFLRDKSKVFSKNNKHEGSDTPPSLLDDLANQEPGLPTSLVPKYSEQELQWILQMVLVISRLRDFNKSRKKI